MKERQATSFQRTRDAIGALISMGIRSPHQAAEAIRANRVDVGTKSTIKVAYGSTPEVRKALSTARPS